MKSKFAPVSDALPESSSATIAVNEAASTTTTTTPKRSSFRPEAAPFIPGASMLTAPTASGTPVAVHRTPSAPTGPVTPVVTATPQREAPISSGFTPVDTLIPGLGNQNLTDSRWAKAPATAAGIHKQEKRQSHHLRAPNSIGNEHGTSTHPQQPQKQPQTHTPPALLMPPVNSSNKAQGSPPRSPRLRLRIPLHSQAPPREEPEPLTVPPQRPTGFPRSPPPQTPPIGAPALIPAAPASAGPAATTGGDFGGSRRGRNASHRREYDYPYPARNPLHNHNHSADGQEQLASQGRGRGRGNRESKSRRGN